MILLQVRVQVEKLCLAGWEKKRSGVKHIDTYSEMLGAFLVVKYANFVSLEARDRNAVKTNMYLCLCFSSTLRFGYGTCEKNPTELSLAVS